jgi:pimeloyl-ACP methyl ester carboxylesterase
VWSSAGHVALRSVAVARSTVGKPVATACASDGEFLLAARHWTGGLRFVAGEQVIGVVLQNGAPVPGVPDAGTGVIELSATAEVWEPLLRAVPPRLRNDVSPMLGLGLERRADDLLWWQYLPAVQRAVELLRPTNPALSPIPAPAHRPGAFDAPTGRYVHVELDGLDHRIYFEEAGAGIPLLLQHTAGAHGTQWRHLFECAAITDRFRLIAYDLPFHGKSVPPDGREWWAEPYRLTGEFLRQVPLAVADALDLDRPVFMGCSVGGLLALDLACRHPDRFRAVISLEGALHIGGDIDDLAGFWHPQVSNETKARMMDGLMAPTSPIARRKETTQIYAAGWPPAFLGDLWYYLVDYDLRERAHQIDTARVAVHILSGEYDYSGSVELGREAHEAIAGSTFTEMPGVGHFPMSENPVLFLSHLLPVLDSIAAPC